MELPKKQQKYYIYILKCRDGSLYTGYTTDIASRLKRHKRGKGSKYVRSRLPFELVYQEEYGNKSTAMKREAEIKGLKRSEKYKLVNG